MKKISLCIANGENAAGGAGITAKTAHELKIAGIHAITLGDHVWDQKNFENEIEELDFVCRLYKSLRNQIRVGII